MYTKWMTGLLIGLLVLATITFFGLGFHRKPHYIANFEEQEYGTQQPFVVPESVGDGLAVYSLGDGDPVLLFPYPHGHTIEPMAQSVLAEMLVEMGYQVITFDVPGAYRSTREPVGDMNEMLDSADQALERLDIEGPVDVVGHSMGGLSALAYAIERPERTNRLILVGAMSGFPAAARWGLPGSTFNMTELDYWRIIVWGMQVNAGRGNLAVHKKLQNLMEEASYYNKSLFTPVTIDPGDEEEGVPIRMIWTRNMYRRLSYVDRLSEVQAPTLVLVGRHDPEAPVPCSEELVAGIPDSSLIVFEESGHFPFVEESDLFFEAVDVFLND